MISKSPSGALSPYYYKGGYFHGIHYGSYFNDMNALRDMITREEEFIMKSPQKRRVMIDLHETNLTPPMVAEFSAHIGRLQDKIYKLAIAGDNKTIRAVRSSLLKANALGKGQMYFCFDMEEGKTWLVSDSAH